MSPHMQLAFWDIKTETIIVEWIGFKWQLD